VRNAPQQKKGGRELGTRRLTEEEATGGGVAWRGGVPMALRQGGWFGEQLRQPGILLGLSEREEGVRARLATVTRGDGNRGGSDTTYR
jgi:hypothetical protein